MVVRCYAECDGWINSSFWKLDVSENTIVWNSLFISTLFRRWLWKLGTVSVTTPGINVDCYSQPSAQHDIVSNVGNKTEQGPDSV